MATRKKAPARAKPSVRETAPETPAPAAPAAAESAAPPPAADVGALVLTERGYRDSCLGRVLQIKIFRAGYTPLTWGEVWKRFSEAYPGKWAVQVFPPPDQLVDGKDVYHLFVLEGEPAGLSIR